MYLPNKISQTKNASDMNPPSQIPFSTKTIKRKFLRTIALEQKPFEKTPEKNAPWTNSQKPKNILIEPKRPGLRSSSCSRFLTRVKYSFAKSAFAFLALSLELSTYFSDYFSITYKVQSVSQDLFVCKIHRGSLLNIAEITLYMLIE
ncbi:hypothetical protein HELRODRAFT_162920 [Helobdella robusta]|uniref:Uncharacterized protein n=1 Tax=Helobdella robusta TaxID=6412 RepID=T1ETD0_HELRO|nr:hypothetical protein HELRODRAFT_162920 [Helobdella robusta]ESN99378.1 hypothetical protein HELRODRAFT_162920 [Helobdella robusta]